MNAKIKDIAVYLPDRVLTNLDIKEQFPDWNDIKYEKTVGIHERHIADTIETAFDMGISACNILFERQKKEQVDFVIYVSQSGERNVPSLACLVQSTLGLSTSIGAFDIALGCSGYVYGLAVAKSLVKSGMASCVLLITTDTVSKFYDTSDVSHISLFGDGATASLITATIEKGIGEFVFGTDGSGSEHLTRKDDGSLYINPVEIFNFTMETVPSMIDNIIALNGQPDYYIFHQANKFMLETLRDANNIPADRFYINMLSVGNTTSSTIPIALRDAVDSKLIKTYDKVLLAGFGVGLSWAGVMITI
jgi:3-oxoacyl-[acyl-carrier-protein] synthase III